MPTKTEPETSVPRKTNDQLPPIESRYEGLRTSPGDLIAWAKEVSGKTVDTREEAIEAILRHEYGNQAFDKWAKKQVWYNAGK